MTLFLFPHEVFSSEEADVIGFSMLFKHPCPGHLQKPGATRGIAAPPINSRQAGCKTEKLAQL